MFKEEASKLNEKITESIEKNDMTNVYELLKTVKESTKDKFSFNDIYKKTIRVLIKRQKFEEIDLLLDQFPLDLDLFHLSIEEYFNHHIKNRKLLESILKKSPKSLGANTCLEKITTHFAIKGNAKSVKYYLSKVSEDESILSQHYVSLILLFSGNIAGINTLISSLNDKQISQLAEEIAGPRSIMDDFKASHYNQKQLLNFLESIDNTFIRSALFYHLIEFKHIQLFCSNASPAAHTEMSEVDKFDLIKPIFLALPFFSDEKHGNFNIFNGKEDKTIELNSLISQITGGGRDRLAHSLVEGSMTIRNGFVGLKRHYELENILGFLEKIDNIKIRCAVAYYLFKQQYLVISQTNSQFSSTESFFKISKDDKQKKEELPKNEQTATIAAQKTTSFL